MSGKSVHMENTCIKKEGNSSLVVYYFVKYGQTSMARTSLGPFTLNMGSSSHLAFIKAPG